MKFEIRIYPFLRQMRDANICVSALFVTFFTAPECLPSLGCELPFYRLFSSFTPAIRSHIALPRLLGGKFPGRDLPQR